MRGPAGTSFSFLFSWAKAIYWVTMDGIDETIERNTMKKVGIVIGSLREASYSRRLAKEFMKLFPEDYEAEIVEIRDLPLYNEDWDQGEPPQEVVEFRKKLKECDAFVFVTPEYNRSIPGVLKNAVDVGSRPPGQSKWLQKPAAVISNSPGVYGGFGANHHLRQALVFSDMPLVQQPEVYLSAIDKAWDEEGNFNERTKGLLQKLMDAFVKLTQ